MGHYMTPAVKHAMAALTADALHHSESLLAR